MFVVCIEANLKLRRMLDLTLGKRYKVLYDDGMYHIEDDNGTVRVYNKEIFMEER